MMPGPVSNSGGSIHDEGPYSAMDDLFLVRILSKSNFKYLDLFGHNHVYCLYLVAMFVSSSLVAKITSSEISLANQTEQASLTLVCV